MKKYKALITIIILIILGEVLILSKNTQITPQPKDLQTYVREVLTKCRDEDYKPGCYDREIPKLMDYLTMEEAFKVTFLLQDEDKSYPYCHVLGHKLSAREVQKDPSKWKEVVSRCPSGICSNGCIHGGFQERFRAESFTNEEIEKIKPDLLEVCEARANWQPTGLEQGSCYHAMGHLTMYLTSADISKSILLCEQIGKKGDGRDFSPLCFDGVFMQIYQPLEAEDFALIKGKEIKKDDVSPFCKKFEGAKKSSCLSESWPLFPEVKTPKGLVEFCSKQEALEQDLCFMDMVYVLTSQFNFDDQKIQEFCLGLPAKRQGRCFADASSRMIETDYRNIGKSVNICSNSQSDENKNICFGELLKFSTYNFHPESPQFLQLCNTLPSPWNNKCLSRS